jgi:hypothetical protein
MSIRFFYSRVYSVRVFFYFGPARNDFFDFGWLPESRRILFVQSTLDFRLPFRSGPFFGYIFSDIRSFKILFDSGPSRNNLYFNSIIEPPTKWILFTEFTLVRDSFYYSEPGPVILATVLPIFLQSIQSFQYFSIPEPFRNDLISIVFLEPYGFYSSDLFQSSPVIPTRPGFSFSAAFNRSDTFRLPNRSGMIFDFNFMVEPLRNGFYSPNLLSFTIFFIIPQRFRIFWL